MEFFKSIESAFTHAFEANSEKDDKGNAITATEKPMNVEEYKQYKKEQLREKFNEEYELAINIGNKRFGSECKHLKTKNGYCLNCYRKIIAKIRRI